MVVSVACLGPRTTETIQKTFSANSFYCVVCHTQSCQKVGPWPYLFDMNWLGFYASADNKLGDGNWIGQGGGGGGDVEGGWGEGRWESGG